MKPTDRNLSLDAAVSLCGSPAAHGELDKLRSTASEAHIAWSVAAGYFEQSQERSSFFPSLRPVFRKEASEAAKVARVKEAFMSALSNTREDTVQLLLDALASEDSAAKDVLIMQAIDRVGALPGLK